MASTIPVRSEFEPGDEAAGVPQSSVPGLDELWAETLGDPEITIAILDGPVDADHPSLSASNLQVIDFMGRGGVDGPAGHHGTHAASIIFGSHAGPVKGIVPHCRGLVIPIFRDAGNRIAPCSQPDLARAIRLASSLGAQVINVSAGEISPNGLPHPLLNEAVQECAAAGRLIVAAAGNNGCDCLHVPGALPSVLAVGAMDEAGNPMEFSNWGSTYRTGGLLAPGVNVLGAVPRDGVCRRTGTSFAAPVVSGVAGLLLSLQRRRGLPPDTRAVRAALLETGQGCEHREVPDCRRLLAGRLNVRGAVAQILRGATTMTESTTTKTAQVTETAAGPEAVAVAERGGDGATESRPTVAQHAVVPGSSEIRDAVSDEPRRQTPDNRSPPSRSATGRSSRGVSAAVLASDCSCQHNGQLVFAIGDLDIDFGTQARLDSIQQHAGTFDRGPRLDVRIHGHLLRHLLGFREWFTADPNKRMSSAEDKAFELHRGHMYDADSVIWVLRQDESPLYAIRPSGFDAAEAYLELAHFLMEQEGYDERPEAFRDPEADNPLETLVYPSLDMDDMEEANRRMKPNRREPVRIVERVAIPGRLNGEVELYNGSVIPVVCPEMRGTTSWSMPELVRAYGEVPLPKSAEEESSLSKDERVPVRRTRFMEGLAQRFFEEARNRGLSPEERALNFMATQMFRMAPRVRDFFHVDFDPELDSIVVQPSPTCREDSECYDVEVAFFDPENVLRSKLVVARTIDVSDVVPVPLADERVYRRR